MAMRNAFDFFDAIYCINLDGEPERWHAIQSQFETAGIKDRVVRFSGVKDDVRSRGCSLTHLKLIEHARSERLSNVFIFEDDTVFLDWNGRVLENALNALPDDWGLFNVGYNLFAEYSGIRYRQLSENLIRVEKGSDVRSNNAYAVNHNVFDTLIDNYRRHFDTWKDDVGMWHLDQWYARNFDRYCVIPLMSVQDQGNKPQIFVSNYEKFIENHVPGGCC